MSDSEKLAAIEQAIRDYHYGFDTREHGGVLAGRLVNRVKEILGMPWNQGEEKERRRASAVADRGKQGRSYSVQNDYDEFWNMNAPDEKWSYTDKAGHVHHYEAKGDGHYPTLEVKSETETEYHEDGEEYEVINRWYVCRQCGEVIRPGKTERMEHILIGTRYTVDGEPVAKPEFERMFAEDRANQQA